MKNILKLTGLVILTNVAFLASATCPTDAAYPTATFPELTINTSMGEVVVELDRSRAPLTVNHFLHLVKDQTYDNNIVHRVVADYVVQTGAFKTDYSEVEGCGELFNESGNGLSNERGTLAMARFDAPHSASTSFYINVKDNSNLNPSSKSWGYAVFGYVVSGMEIIDQIAQQKTEFNLKLNTKDVPIEPIKIISVRINK